MIWNKVLAKREGVVSRSFSLLLLSDRKKLILVIILQIMFGILDLIAVGIIGILSSLSITGVSGGIPGDRVSLVLRILSFDQLSLQAQVSLLAITAVLLLLTKTILSVIFVRRTIFFMATRGAQISSELISRVLRQKLTSIQATSTQDILYRVTSGVQSIVMGVLNRATMLISDIALICILIAGLFAIDPFVAISTLVVFSSVALLLHKLLQDRALVLGEKSRELSIQSNESILEVIYLYREIFVRNRRDYFAEYIGRVQRSMAATQAESTFMPLISKYVFEVTMVFGCTFIAAIQFLTNDAARATATLMVFLAASFRIAPAVLRLQTGFIGFRMEMGQAEPTLDLIEMLRLESYEKNTWQPLTIEHREFIPSVIADKVTLTYPGTNAPSLSDVSFALDSGEFLAIVGPSGSGKTTMLDTLLGIREPDSGSLRISGLTPSNAIAKWPGAIGYVPQEVMLSNGSIKENIALGFCETDFSEALVWDAIDLADLTEFVESLPHGLRTRVGDRGVRLSGGQKQRIAIARALFTKPRLIIFDEATSALDGTTEENVTKSVGKLKEKASLIVVAHRLSTIREADRVMYLDKGKCVASGTFEEVRNQISDFDRQASMLGL